MNNDAFLSLFSQPPVREIATDDEEAVLDGDFGIAEHGGVWMNPACEDAPKDGESQTPGCGRSGSPEASAPITEPAAQAPQEAPMAGLEDVPEIDGPYLWAEADSLEAPVDSCADWDEERYLDGSFGAPDGERDAVTGGASDDQPGGGPVWGSDPEQNRSDAPHSTISGGADADAVCAMGEDVARASGGMSAMGTPGEGISPSAASAADAAQDDYDRWLDTQPAEACETRREDAPKNLTSAANRVLLADLGEANAASIELSLDEWGMIPRPQPMAQMQASTQSQIWMPPQTQPMAQMQAPMQSQAPMPPTQSQADGPYGSQPHAATWDVSIPRDVSDVPETATEVVEAGERTARDTPMRDLPIEDPLRAASQTPSPETLQITYDWAVSLDNSEAGTSRDEGENQAAAGTSAQIGAQTGAQTGAQSAPWTQPQTSSGLQAPPEVKMPAQWRLQPEPQIQPEIPSQPASPMPPDRPAPAHTWIHLESSQPAAPDEEYLDGAVGTFTPFEALLDGTYEPVLGAEDVDVTVDGKGDHAWRNAR